MNAREFLHGCLRALRVEFPEAKVLDSRIEFRMGERSDLRDAESWDDCSVRVQVGNDHGSGDTFEEALAALRKELDVKARIAEKAEHVAVILREVPDEGFERSNVLRAAELILEQERIESRRAR
jgi:hypothetical protein